MNAESRVILTPTQLNNDIRHALERGFPLLWVEGEISNLARPASGHWYFSLKDAGAQVRCAMFRNRNMLLRFRPENGAKVLVRARLTVYEPRGEYQLMVDHMEEAGHGALQRAFEELKAKLQAEGLFEAERKRPLPHLPRRIGVVTSPTGAAIRDVLSTLARRFPLAEVILYPTQVQGADAPEQIVRALALAGGRAECDVLLLVRGGGSLEDLMAFNDERVARAVAASPIPVVCGVGHEVDFTIADFAADVRAPTPTGAAELVTPDQRDWLRRLNQLEARIEQTTRRRLAQHAARQEWLARRLQQLHPGQKLRQQAQRLDELEMRLSRATRVHLRHREHDLAKLHARLREHSPQARIVSLGNRNDALRHRLERAGTGLLGTKRQRLAELGRALNAVSPLATLQRGYAIVRDADSGAVRTRVTELTAGGRVCGQLQDGEFVAVVETIKETGK